MPFSSLRFRSGSQALRSDRSRARRRSLAAGALGAVLLAAGPLAPGSDILPGPVAAQVIEVVDGDTIAVRAHVWLGQNIETHVRLFGIDAPELKGRCPREIELAQAARRFLESEVGGRAVTLRDIRHDKYGGRVLARVEWPAGRDIGQELERRGLARAYDGRARAPWCTPS